MLEPIADTDYLITSDAYFVAPNGLDTNTGRDARSPWPFQKTLQQAPNGATIVFRGGSYRGVNKYGVKRRYILQAYPHEQAWIKGSLVVTGWIADGGLWRKDNWLTSFPTNVGSEFIDPAYPLSAERDMVYRNGVSVRQVATKAEVVPGTFFLDKTAKKIWIGDDPTGAEMEVTAYDNGLNITKTAEFNPAETVIRGLGFAHYAERAIVIACPKVTLEKNTLTWNGIYGVKYEPASAGVLPICTDNVLNGNTFSYNGRGGANGDRVDRVHVKNNIFKKNNIERSDQRHDAAGIKLVRTRDMFLHNNLCEENMGAGIWIDISSINARVVHNLVRNNERYGIFFEISHGAIIASNLLYGNASGVHVTNSSAAKVYNNTLFGNGHNLHVDDSTTRRNTSPSEIALGAEWITKDTVIKNNLLSNYAFTFGDGLHFQATCNGANASQMVAAGLDSIDYNCYHRTSTSSYGKTVRWTINSANALYASASNFRSATGYEAHCLILNNLPINDLFVDKDNGNYALKAGSAAINAGVALPADVASAIGVTPGVAVNAGILTQTLPIEPVPEPPTPPIPNPPPTYLSPYAAQVEVLTAEINQYFVDTFELRTPYTKEGIHPGDRYGVINFKNYANRPQIGAATDPQPKLMQLELKLTLGCEDWIDARAKATSFAFNLDNFVALLKARFDTKAWTSEFVMGTIYQVIDKSIQYPFAWIVDLSCEGSVKILVRKDVAGKHIL